MPDLPEHGDRPLRELPSRNSSSACGARALISPAIIRLNSLCRSRPFAMLLFDHRLVIEGRFRIYSAAPTPIAGRDAGAGAHCPGFLAHILPMNVSLMPDRKRQANLQSTRRERPFHRGIISASSSLTSAQNAAGQRVSCFTVPPRPR